MKAVLAAVIAAAALWIVDTNFNGGDYTLAAMRMARPMLAHLGILI
jgi:hypothetical protein